MGPNALLIGAGVEPDGTQCTINRCWGAGYHLVTPIRRNQTKAVGRMATPGCVCLRFMMQGLNLEVRD